MNFGTVFQNYFGPIVGSDECYKISVGPIVSSDEFWNSVPPNGGKVQAKLN